VLALALAPRAEAALEDEIQVYLDELNAAREWGLELHVNSTPAGVATPSYPGEVVSAHGTRLTSELSYGLGGGFEAGFYLPALVEANGRADVAGAKVRLKWVPVHGDAASGGWFAGANAELSRVAARYSESRWGSELRLIGGRRIDGWTVGLNPVFDWALSDGRARATPDFNIGFKLARQVTAGVAFGAEYYADLGPLDHVAPWTRQDHRLYVTTDVDRRPWVFNLGLGYGLTAAADRWTVKLILEVPLRTASSD
jgi:hypothetical protein